MDASQAAHALARASATLTDRHDVAGALTALLRSCRDTLEGGTAGILIQSDRHLELLAASSHEAVELETHQAQLDEGPCVDAHATGLATRASGRAVLLERWPTFGVTMVDRGYQSVHASPLMWRGSTIGAMGLFRHSAEPFTDDDDVFAQAFADIATLLIVNTEDLAGDELAARLHHVLTSRIVIEQAKGVLAEQHGLSMADAYDLLVLSSLDKRTGLSEWAARVVHAAQQLG